MEKLFKNKFYIEIVVASFLFMYAIFTNDVISVIINLLYFIIFLEIVRIISDFIQEHRIKLRLIIDTFIILTLREFIVNVVKVNQEELAGVDDILSSSLNSHIMIFSGVLIFLFILRWFSLLTSPDNKAWIKDVHKDRREA